MGGIKHSASKFKRGMQSSVPEEDSNLALLVAEPNLVVHAPIISSYNDRIRPLLDAVDSLRHLMVMKEGIQLPTIVVVGDQSSGKSSVLESLACINLPRGQGICTRVPLIMRLQHVPTLEPQIYLEFNGKIVPTDEAHVADAIVIATDEIAGSGKGISNIPLTLVVKKNGVPDLTMVDLPGITRVPVHGQPENIYEQISGIIMEYIKPLESIILNVLSANVDFSTCESIRMSQIVDKTGERTLAVVTKSDKAPEGLLEKVTADDVRIGLGYVCVRNRIGEESYEDARIEEARLFETHPLLSRIDKSLVGIPVLAQKLVQIQAGSVARCLPEIFKSINEKLNANISELNKMPKKMSSVAEAMAAFMRIVGSVKETLRKIFLKGEFDEYPDDEHMHCTAQFAKMLNKFSNGLQNCVDNDQTKNFLMEEIVILEESNGIGLPNFLPRSAFLAILRRKINKISRFPVEFLEEVWNFIEGVLLTVLTKHSALYHQLQFSIRRACPNLIRKMKEQSVNIVMDMVEMERLTDYSCNPEYMFEWTKLMTQQEAFLKAVTSKGPHVSKIYLQDFGNIELNEICKHQQVLHQAFDLKMRMTAYLKIVLRRLVDNIALHLQFFICNLVNKELEIEILNELIGPQGVGIERMLGESPALAGKRDKLNMSIKLLTEAKEVVAKIIDRITIDVD